MEPYRHVKHFIKRRLSGRELNTLLRRTGIHFESPPVQRPSKPDRVGSVKAACILDDFTYDQFRQVMELVPIDPERWFEPFQAGVDMLLVESFWRGSGGSWKGIAYDYNPKERELLRRIVRWCRQAGVPTVFWNKEDPVHFDEFVDLAMEFDHIFTTDAGCIAKYRALGKEAEVLMFSAMPSLHNPIEVYGSREDKVCFAGSWMPMYPARMADFERIAQAISDYGLDIYDRNLERGDPRYAFPEKYRGMIRGTLIGEEILRAYKGYRFGLNLNSVKDSETMLARRTFELMACNTPVLSNDSLALRKIFGDLAICSDDAAHIRRKLEELRGDEDAYRRFRQAALRAVMLDHTIDDRVGQICSKVFSLPAPIKFRKAICLLSGGPRERRVLAEFRAQSHRHKETRLMPGGQREHEALWKQAVSENALLVNLSDSDHYGPNFLRDMVMAFFYSEAAMVTKVSHYRRGAGLVDPGRQFRWVQEVVPGSLMIDPAKIGWEEAMALWDGRSRSTSKRCLSVDEFNYLEGAGVNQDASHYDC
jgi:hypothetical protein